MKNNKEYLETIKNHIVDIDKWIIQGIELKLKNNQEKLEAVKKNYVENSLKIILKVANLYFENKTLLTQDPKKIQENIMNSIEIWHDYFPKDTKEWDYMIIWKAPSKTTLSESETAYFLKRNNFFWQIWKGKEAEDIYDRIKNNKFEGISGYQSDFLNKNWIILWDRTDVFYAWNGSSKDENRVAIYYTDIFKALKNREKKNNDYPTIVLLWKTIWTCFECDLTWIDFIKDWEEYEIFELYNKNNENILDYSKEEIIIKQNRTPKCILEKKEGIFKITWENIKQFLKSYRFVLDIEDDEWKKRRIWLVSCLDTSSWTACKLEEVLKDRKRAWIHILKDS